MSLQYDPVNSSGKSAPGSDPRIRHRIQIVMFRPIWVDHTNCLQVAIKTHSFRVNHFTISIFYFRKRLHDLDKVLPHRIVMLHVSECFVHDEAGGTPVILYDLWLVHRSYRITGVPPFIPSLTHKTYYEPLTYVYVYHCLLPERSCDTGL